MVEIPGFNPLPSGIRRYRIFKPSSAFRTSDQRCDRILALTRTTYQMTGRRKVPYRCVVRWFNMSRHEVAPIADDLVVLETV